MKAFPIFYYVLCTIPGILFLSSFGSMTDSDAGAKLTNAIYALMACPLVAFIGLVAAITATAAKSESARGLWIATAVAAAPGLLTIIVLALHLNT